MKNDGLWIGNIHFIVNENVENDKIIFGRKNSIDQPGIHCIICGDKDIVLQEFVDPNNFNTKLVMNFKILDVGFHPEYNYNKTDTKSLSYYRNQKLKRIKEIYGV